MKLLNDVRALILISLLATAGMPMLGGSWTAINSGLPCATQGVIGLALDPAVPSTLYACTSGGDVFESMDGAANWTPVGGVGGANVLPIDPQKTSMLYAGTRNGIFKSAVAMGSRLFPRNSGCSIIARPSRNKSSV